MMILYQPRPPSDKTAQNRPNQYGWGGFSIPVNHAPGFTVFAV